METKNVEIDSLKAIHFSRTLCKYAYICIILADATHKDFSLRKCMKFKPHGDFHDEVPLNLIYFLKLWEHFPKCLQRKVNPLSYSAKSSFKESITFRKYCINPF
jgi:hypothetical protein